MMKSNTAAKRGPNRLNSCNLLSTYLAWSYRFGFLNPYVGFLSQGKMTVYYFMVKSNTV